MKFVVSSPDTLLFDRNEFKREKSNREHFAVSALALIAVGTQVYSFFLIKELMESMV